MSVPSDVLGPRDGLSSDDRITEVQYVGAGVVNVRSWRESYHNGDSYDEHSLTRTGMVMGTPEYLSPEQASGDRKMDGRVDTYAVGIVMYQALVGERPFKGKDSRSLLLSIVKGDHRRLGDMRPDLPSPLVRIVQKAMARSKGDRFPTAEAFAQALSTVLPLLPVPRRSRGKVVAAEPAAPTSTRKGRTGETRARPTRPSGSARATSARAADDDHDDPKTRFRR